MSRITARLWVYLLLGCAVSVLAQQPAVTASSSTVVVPPLVNFSGVLTNVNGKPLAGVVGVTFALYAEQQGGAPLWLETQNVYPDKTGHYTVMLGSTTSTGIPPQIFASGGARWLGVQPEGQAEQARVSVLSVPYAMEAANAQTVGGLPASAFVLAAPPSSPSAKTTGQSAAAKPLVTGTTPVTTAGGTVNAVPLWDSTSDITSSVITQTGSGSTAKVGINTTAPSATLTVNGGLSASGFYIGSNRFAFGSYKAANALLGFAGNLTMTGAGNTGVGYKGLFSNTTGSSNTASGDSALQGNTTGSFNTASGYVALTSNTEGAYNTANGVYSLYLNVTGTENTASGAWTLNNNNGSNNTADGMSSLSLNTTGSYNTATGYQALQSNTTGSDNTALGYAANVGSGGLTNATAIGANSLVSESNALVLGGTGSNAVKVGIGTVTPAYTLDVQGTGNFTGLVTFNSAQAFPNTATLGGNTFTGSQTVNGNLSATGVVTGSSYQIGSNLFAFGSYANQNAFLGFAGSTAIAVGGITGVGYQALYSNVGDSSGDGWYNTAVGYQALYANNDTSNSNDANYNTAVGYQALYANTTGYSNTAIGTYALYSNTGYNASGNTAVGSGALQRNTGGSNTAVGSGALGYNIAGINNTATGLNALVFNNGGSSNVADGWLALGSNTSGSYNTGVGLSALTGNTTGSYNTALGYFAQPGASNLTNATAIGAMALVTQSNSLVLGAIANTNGCNSYTNCTTVNVGIGTTAPDNNLTVNGTADKPGGGSWGTYSDRRLKTVDGSFNSGLSQILKLRPVRYRYDKENALGIHDEQEHVGLLAQDVQKVIPEAVTENSKGYLLLNNDPIIWTMLNAIKDQQKLIQQQQQEIARLKSQVKTIQTTLKSVSPNSSEVRVVKAQLSVAHH